MPEPFSVAGRIVPTPLAPKVTCSGCGDAITMRRIDGGYVSEPCARCKSARVVLDFSEPGQ